MKRLQDAIEARLPQPSRRTAVLLFGSFAFLTLWWAWTNISGMPEEEQRSLWLRFGVASSVLFATVAVTGLVTRMRLKRGHQIREREGLWPTIAVGLAAGGVGSLMTHLDLRWLVLFMGGGFGGFVAATFSPITGKPTDPDKEVDLLRTDLPMSPFPFDERFPGILRSLTPEARALLLRVLSLPEADRAKAIGELHQRSGDGALVELLIDLEEGPDGEQLRAWIANQLRKGDDLG